MKYMSKEWWEAVQKKTNEDREYLKKSRSLTMNFQLLITDAPGGIDRLVSAEMERGKIKNISLEDKSAPSDWRTAPTDLKKYLYRGSAPYEIFCAVHKGEIPLMQAMTKGFKIEGDMQALMGKIGDYMQLQNIQASVTAEY